MLPLIASDLFHHGPGGYGILLGCLGSGATAAAGVLPRLRFHRSVNFLITAGNILTAFAIKGLAITDYFAVGCALLFLAVFAWLVCMSGFNISVQTLVPNCVKVQAFSAYLMFFSVAMTIGSALFGELAANFELESSLIIASAIVCRNACKMAVKYSTSKKT